MELNFSKARASQFTALDSCTPDYAFGTSGFPPWGIQPNSPLTFEIEVLSVQKKRLTFEIEEEEEVSDAIDQLDEPEFSKSAEKLYNALASDTSTSSDEDDNKNSQKQMKKKNKQALLPWMRKPLDIDKFKDCPLSVIPCLDPRLEDVLRNMGYESLFAVQLAVWHLTIGPGSFERDICVNSPTGSGKTLAYALPIVQALSAKKLRCLYALIVVPTRDLAMQVKQIFDALAPAVGLNVGLAVDQSSIEEERSYLIRKPELEMGMSFDPDDLQVEERSNVDILVATPGRLVDHINTTKGFTMEHLRYLVVDEVDRLVGEAYQFWIPPLLQMAFSDERRDFRQDCVLTSLRTIRRSSVVRGSKFNPYPRLAKMIFSATLPKDPNKLEQLHLHHPVYLTSGGRCCSLPKKLESYGLKGLAAIVGVGPKLGRSIALKFAQEGFTVAILARDLDKLSRFAEEISRQGKVFPIRIDCSDSRSVREAFEGVLSLGFVEVLVYNACHDVPSGIATRTTDVTLESFERSLAVSGVGAFHCAQQVIPGMSERARGTILFTGMSASITGIAGSTALSCGKFTMSALSQCLAKELQPAGVHAAHVIVDGPIGVSGCSMGGENKAESIMDPDVLAQTYWNLHVQDKCDWVQEIDLRSPAEANLS